MGRAMNLTIHGENYNFMILKSIVEDIKISLTYNQWIQRVGAKGLYLESDNVNFHGDSDK